MPEAVVVSAARSAIGRAGKGSLKDVRPDDLVTEVILAALRKIPELDPSSIDDLHLGCAEPQDEQGRNMARRIAVLMGNDSMPGTTVVRACASSLQTARMALHAIKAGEGDTFISAGVECVSRFHGGMAGVFDPSTDNPKFADARHRTERIAKRGESWSDPREDGLLPDGYISMGQTAENVARYKNISREDQDEFAVRSQRLAQDAIEAGFFAREIVPIRTPDGNLVTRDDCPRNGVTLEGVSALKPVFRRDGTVTAGNSCPLNDGAAATVIMSDTRAKELGIIPLARIVSTGVSGLSPEIMGLGPVEASRRALKLAGLSVDDVDLWEINEAFAAQVVASSREIGFDPERLNVHGGAIALGHPFGSTGARLMGTLINGLQTRDAEIGVESMCVGGGQGMALVLERLS
ncbi:acetyl-CoA C-acetyltransferase [Rhodococcus sp. USK13]|uniref:acetyl-CoA C-acetyltransferase n=1 Tax=Rhodococcus sp. USK13 TaxID=2806442 RepID=UPI001BCF3E28|nr:acetyl-CoA C-acetyltransferase [Rhodococcus sp. USK13]